jgi:PhnB protein
VRLRAALECRLLCPVPNLDVSSTSGPRAGFHSVTPRIVVSDVTAQIEFLRAVFDGTSELHPGRPAEIHVGDSLIMVTSTTEREPFPAFLYIYVDDADDTYQRALAAGATPLEAPLDTPYGDRRAMVRDPFGNVFQIAHQMRQS